MTQPRLVERKLIVRGPYEVMDWDKNPSQADQMADEIEGLLDKAAEALRNALQEIDPRLELDKEED